MIIIIINENKNPPSLHASPPEKIASAYVKKVVKKSSYPRTMQTSYFMEYIRHS